MPLRIYGPVFYVFVPILISVHIKTCQKKKILRLQTYNGTTQSKYYYPNGVIRQSVLDGCIQKHILCTTTVPRYLPLHLMWSLR